MKQVTKMKPGFVVGGGSMAINHKVWDKIPVAYLQSA